MAPKARKLNVFYTPSALATLDEIWEWNEKTYSRSHANGYISFLRAETDKLATGYLKWKQVPTRPERRYMTIRRKNRGYGHIAICSVIGGTVNVLDYFHTSQDWQTRSGEEDDE